ncbi:type 1 glutamine amidotransferase [Roseinatronobacter alkalisoli]|uniref:Type 1 glutamine amidotransferase n=1 Tax=Roseinatronobacter alkalisoli TaxID=3028235 RepID=A0ABT5TCS4_9RHOB|nr:type 1 glutamine amidotransferase [Roseinatronobacter sp. HJB301]MDD7972925.1 type 1 glutamine amidotransferase [Roseinatronobacter sp. HJB301]
MKIGILQTGRTPVELRAKHGDYDDLFRAFLAGQGFTFETFAVLDGVLPAGPNDADGWLITGSRFGVYEGHPWIAPLESFLRAVYAKGVPIIGVCFGHQILAQALGGKVEKFSGGWSVGATQYDTDTGSKRIMAWHQDQVTQPPKDARVAGHTDFCENAILVYGDKALTMQPHPEFTPEFMVDLLDARGVVLPPETAQSARKGMSAELATEDIADMFAEFLRRPRPDVTNNAP